MAFTGFDSKDFDAFKLEGLDERMEAIQERIQPKFKAIGETLSAELSTIAGNEMFLHIARHARRTVNPPKDTWLAIANNKRGYKQHPHFQVGLFDDHVFIWLAYIYEVPNKKEIARRLINNIGTINKIVPNNYVVSLDHMKKKADLIEEIDLKKSLERFRDVKKAEFLVGRHIDANDPILRDGDKFMNLISDTFGTLFPIYRMSFE